MDSNTVQQTCPRDSVDKTWGWRAGFLSLLRPEGHVLNTAWGAMIKPILARLLMLLSINTIDHKKFHSSTSNKGLQNDDILMVLYH